MNPNLSCVRYLCVHVRAIKFKITTDWQKSAKASASARPANLGMWKTARSHGVAPESIHTCGNQIENRFLRQNRVIQGIRTAVVRAKSDSMRMRGAIFRPPPPPFAPSPLLSQWICRGRYSTATSCTTAQCGDGQQAIWQNPWSCQLSIAKLAQQQDP